MMTFFLMLQPLLFLAWAQNNYAYMMVLGMQLLVKADVSFPVN